MQATELIMGMPISLEVVGMLRKPRKPRKRWRKRSTFRFVDATFSPYKPDSEISRLQRNELRRTEMSLLVQEIMLACEAAQEETNGYFSTTINGKYDPSGSVKGWVIQQVAQQLDAYTFCGYCMDAGCAYL